MDKKNPLEEGLGAPDLSLMSKNKDYCEGYTVAEREKLTELSRLMMRLWRSADIHVGIVFFAFFQDYR